MSLWLNLTTSFEMLYLNAAGQIEIESCVMLEEEEEEEEQGIESTLKLAHSIFDDNNPLSNKTRQDGTGPVSKLTTPFSSGGKNKLLRN